MREKRQTKFVTPEEAVQAVRNRDWVDYASEPVSRSCWTGRWPGGKGTYRK